MVGPSSSHTLGAAKLGAFVRQFSAASLSSCQVVLYGSFAQTYKGHRTDIAIVGGLIGIPYDDERLRNSFEIAREMGFSCEISASESTLYSGNVAAFNIATPDGKSYSIYGESIGGGRINIFKINSMSVDIDGEYPTLITVHKDAPGILAKITQIIASENINIAFLKLFREEKHESAILVAQTDEALPPEAIQRIAGFDLVLEAMFIAPL